MKKEILVTTLTLVLAIGSVACTNKDVAEDNNASAEATTSEAATVSESVEETSSEAASEASTAASMETADAIYIQPANIPLVDEGADAPDAELYFQNKSDIKSSDIYLGTITLVNGSNKATAEVNAALFPDINKCTRIVTDDNREYLYLETDCENDYFHLFVFDITDGKAELAGDEWFSYSGGLDFSDIDNMKFSNYTECLCMFSYHNECIVGPDGMPTPKDDISDIEGERSVTSKKALDLEIVDEEGNGTGTKKTVPKESTYTLVHVYKDCGIDAKLDDGTIVRIPVTSIGYDAECNGVPLNDLFVTGV